MAIRPLHGLGRRLLVGGGALTGMLLGWTGASVVSAQPREVSPPPVVAPEATAVKRNHLNKQQIRLPIDIPSEQARSLIAEIQLYVKEQASAPWTMRDKVGPTAREFTFQAPRDGEYFFAMVTVDKQGRSYPADVRNEPAGLIVVIDTQPPTIELTNLGQTPEGQLIHCEARDPHLNAGRTQLQYQGGEGAFYSLDPLPGQLGVYCVPKQSVFTGVIRASAADMAGNQVTREAQVRDLATVKSAAPAQTGPQTLIVDQKPGPINPPNTLPRGLGSAPSLTPEAPRNPARPDGTDGPRLPGAVIEAGAVTPAPARENLKRQFVNSTKVFLDYQVENAVQNSAATVEVWITRDRAKTWQKLSEQSQAKTSLEVQFPGEGIFGVTLVASNGKAVAAPHAGDAPDWWIEVDTTRPISQFNKVDVVIENGAKVVHIAWTASDANLADGPVDLFYGTAPEGPWLPIAKGLAAQGQHRWTPGANVTGKMYLQMTARDTAGNATVMRALETVDLQPAAPPRAVIRGISTGASSPAPTVTLPQAPTFPRMP
ncbi:MAG: hypothetical protein HY289_01995 [Planctomycetes bacterium]|nr:hypothetical protein [Planctomycetota bacterium]